MSGTSPSIILDTAIFSQQQKKKKKSRACSTFVNSHSGPSLLKNSIASRNPGSRSFIFLLETRYCTFSAIKHESMKGLQAHPFHYSKHES